MPYVNVPNDLSKIKTKLAFNLTKRQLVCFGIAAAVGIPSYLRARSAIGNTGAMVMVDRANGEVFAQTTAPDGSKGYYSCLIVNKKSPLQNLDDMFA